MGVEKVVVSNGITVVVHSDRKFHSVSYAVCCAGGVCGESEELIGVTHLVEHLLFKRTLQQASPEIARTIDELGGEINAFTDLDSMCIYGTVPASRALRLMDFVSELLVHTAFDSTDLNLEREVIRQEILEASDNPLDMLYQALCSVLWRDSIFRHPVFGNLKSIERFTLEDAKARHSEILRGKRIVIGAAGNISTAEVVRHVEQCFSSLPQGEPLVVTPPAPGAGLVRVARPIRQAHIALAKPWPAYTSDEYPAALAIALGLGDGMSSRLFRLLREEQALTYDVGAHVDGFSSASALLIAASVDPSKVPLALELILGEVEDIVRNGFTEGELERALAMLTAQVEMEQDSVGSLLWRAIESELYYQRYVSPTETLARYEKLTTDRLKEVAKRYLVDTTGVIALGGDVGDVDVKEFHRRWCGTSKLEETAV